MAHVHYYLTHPVHGRHVTLDPTWIEPMKAEGWSLESEWHPAYKPAEPAKQESEPSKRRPGRPRKVTDEHSAADH